LTSDLLQAKQDDFMVRLEIVMMEIELRYGGSQLKKYLHVMV
jgi:hypothetical protein